LDRDDNDTKLPTEPQKRKKQQRNANGQGTIYWSEKRKRWVAEIYDINHKRIPKIFRLKKDAQNWIDEQKRLRTFGQTQYTVYRKMTVTEFLESWVTYRSRRLAPEAVRSYKGAIKRINPYIGAHIVSQLSPHALEELFASLEEKGFSISTQKNAYALLRAAFNYAVKMGDLLINPINKIDAPDGFVGTTPQIPRADFEKIYRAAAMNPYTHARIEIGAIVGPRVGETLGLQWSDVDWERGYIRIDRQLQRVAGDGLIFRDVKQKRKREVRVSQTTLQILHAHQQIQNIEKERWLKDYGLIFPNTIGAPLDAKRDRKWFMDLLERAGVPHYTVYQLRKTAFTMFASTGADLATVKQYTGHSTTSVIFDHYAFSTDQSMEVALARMDALRPQIT